MNQSATIVALYNIIRILKHNKHMKATIVLTVLQCLLTLLFMPVRVRLKGHFSLIYENAQLDVRALWFTLVRLRLKQRHGAIALTVNGKPPKQSGKTRINALKALNDISNEGIRINGSLIALIGGDDAMVSSIAGCVATCMVAPLTEHCAIYSSCEGDRCELDCAVSATINIIQFIGVVLSGK